MFMLELEQPVPYCHVRSPLYSPLLSSLFCWRHFFHFVILLFSVTDAHSKGLFIGMKNWKRIPLLFFLSFYTFLHYLYALIFFAFFVRFTFNKRFSANFYLFLFIWRTCKYACTYMCVYESVSINVRAYASYRTSCRHLTSSVCYCR